MLQEAANTIVMDGMFIMLPSGSKQHLTTTSLTLQGHFNDLCYQHWLKFDHGDTEYALTLKEPDFQHLMSPAGNLLDGPFSNQWTGIKANC